MSTAVCLRPNVYTAAVILTALTALYAQARGHLYLADRIVLCLLRAALWC